MIRWKKKSPTSVLSLDWRADAVHFEWIRKQGSVCRSETRGTMELPADLFQSNPESLGEKLREVLDGLNIREKACVSSLHIGWLFTMRTEVPDLESEDLEFFYTTQAERAFPLPIEDLRVARSVFQSPDRKKHALMAAIPTQRLDHLNQILESARLNPVSWSLSCAGPAFLQSFPDAHSLCLTPTASGLDLLVVSGQRLAMARSLSATDQASQIAREIKISIGELSADLQSAIKQCFYFGPPSMEGCLEEALQQVADRMGFKPAHLQSEVSAAFGLAKDFLLGQGNPFEFLPPKVSPFQEWAQRISTGRNKWVGGGAAAAVILIGCVFFWQGQQLQALEKEWQGMEVQVGELEALQQRIRTYRPWFDESIPTLKLIRHLTTAFPEQGDVWVKELDIREPAQVLCSGFARSNRAWLDMYEKLRTSPEVKDLTVEQVREDRQLQFSFKYRWEEARQ